MSCLSDRTVRPSYRIGPVLLSGASAKFGIILALRALRCYMIRLRELTPEEQQMIERLAHSRTAEARVVERVRLIWHASQGLSVPAIAAELGLHAQTVRQWLKRFNRRGLEGLHDLPRGGRPATYPPEQV